MIIDNTPIETYEINGCPVLVKREDRCAPLGAPPFSKIRGIMLYFKKLKAQGVSVVGYTETSISMAGWGVAWACKILGMTAIIFDPQYKITPSYLAYHRKQWTKYGASIEPIPAGMAKVNWYISKKILLNKYGPEAVLLPLGLPFEESIEATSRETILTLQNHPFKFVSIVVNIGSGTIAAGVWRGVEKLQASATIYGIMGRSGDKDKKLAVVAKKAQIIQDGFFGCKSDFIIVDPGWEYTQKSEAACPFPCHPYYDRKAWQWLIENIENVEPPILFWNIGH